MRHVDERAMRLEAEITQLRTALRETREALQQKVARPPTYFNGSADGNYTCHECGQRGPNYPTDRIAHLHMCPVAVLVRYADLAGEADHA